MTPSQFRKMAMALDGVVEDSHMGHPDFRVGGRIFATLFWTEEDDDCAMVKLAAADQTRLIKESPEVFTPSKGAWGKQGCTQVRLAEARVAMMRGAVEAAWRNVAKVAAAPKSRGVTAKEKARRTKR